MSDLDPTKLSAEELRNEWSVREEELRLQNEQLRDTERKVSEIADRFEIIFQHIPLPIVLLDRRAFVQDANVATYRAFPAIASMKNFFLPRLLTEKTKSNLFTLLEDDTVCGQSTLCLEFRETNQRYFGNLIRFANDSLVYAALVLEPK